MIFRRFMPIPLSTPFVLPIQTQAIDAQGQCDCDCDCACTGGLAYANSEAITPAQENGKWVMPGKFAGPRLAQVSLPGERWLALSPLAPSGALMNAPAARLLESFAAPRTWRSAADELTGFDAEASLQAARQMAGCGLLTPQEGAPAGQQAQPQTLSAWLHLTDRCNLRCSYCYLPHQPRDMSLETGQAALRATFAAAQAHGYQNVKVKYAGGEPLLRAEQLFDLQCYAAELAEQKQIALQGVVLSNGVSLTPAMVGALQTLNLRLAISLDGLGATHDRQRAFPDGRGSAAKALGAIEMALDHGLTPELSITVSSGSASGLPQLMDWVLERSLPFTLNFYRENDLSTGQAGLSLDERAIIEGMLAAYRVIEERLPRRSLLGSLTDRANLSAPHSRTCGVGQNYLVFDPQGQLARCQMQLGQTFPLAAPDPLAAVQAERRGVQNLPASSKKGCDDCQWQAWCSGGCPLATYRVRQRYDAPSPHCNIYQTLLPAALRLEGLRLLRKYDA